MSIRSLFPIFPQGYKEAELSALVRSAIDSRPDDEMTTTPPLPSEMLDIAAFTRRCRGGVSQYDHLSDELFRKEIANALGAVQRASSRPDDADYLPGNRTIVDDVCKKIGWVSLLSPNALKRFYRITSEEIGRMRIVLWTNTATRSKDQTTQASAAQQAKMHRDLVKCRIQLAEIDTVLEEADTLANGAGRTIPEVATLLGLSEPEAKEVIRNAAVMRQTLLTEYASAT